VWEFPSLDAALRDIVDGVPVEIEKVRRLGNVRLQADQSAAKYMLHTTTIINAPVEEAFAFFSKAANLGLITPAAMKFRIEGQVPAMGEGAIITYRVRIGLLPVRWKSRIVSWNPARSFADVQESGPYRMWRHEHAFTAQGARTVMQDRVYYTPPISVLAGLANKLFVARSLRRIFKYRADIIRLRFGA
jgi:ligand-binding SRPBCC domain-containing protein